MIRILLLTILTATSLNAQQQVSGIIVNKDNEPFSFVTVLLLKQTDSVFVSGSATDEKGRFVISNVATGNYLLKASFIGCHDLYEPVEINADVNLGVLTLMENPEELGEVSLSVQRPTIRREVDRLIFNVENTSLSNGSTWEILKRTPSVIVQQNNITVKNQAATVYINDRRVNLSATEVQSLLESFSGTNIKSIEVITNPSAKYDAESGLIINIVTSKNITPGYKGNISGNFEQAIFPKYRVGTGHYFKNKWLNLSVDYSFNKRKEHKNDLGEITFFKTDNSINSFWETDFERITRSETHNINTSLDFTLSDKTTINLSSLILIEPNTTYSNTEVANIFSPQWQLDSLFTTDSGLDLKKHNIALDFSLQHKFNETGTNLSANAHYTNYDNTRDQSVNTNYFLPNGDFLRNNSFLTDAFQETGIMFGQIDFETNLLNSKFETGIKASHIDSKSGIDFFSTDNSANQNEMLSDHFNYEEVILAGYVNFSKDWEKWKLRFGLRGEQTEAEGNSISLVQIREYSYFDLLPNLSLNFIPNQDHSVTFSYKRSIERPRYDLLNPFSYFINENNFTTGNPDLQASTSERFSINYLVEGRYSFEVYYRTSDNPIEVLSFQNNENRFLRSISANMLDKTGYGLEFLHGTSIKPWWYYQMYLSLFHEENTFFAIESNNSRVTVKADGFFTQIYNGFTITKDRSLSADMTLTHLTGLPYGTYLMDPFTTVSLGARKSLWENRASISLTVNDIFDTTNRKLQSDFLNQRNSYFAIQETQYVQLGFTYNFGNFKLQDNKRQIRNEERNRID
tara:strand:- start:170286 stop:172682 length:2397 start_codon:yes stop_codon:yes gene_type:complete